MEEGVEGDEDEDEDEDEDGCSGGNDPGDGDAEFGRRDAGWPNEGSDGAAPLGRG